jgi:predicted ester cyclase
MSVNPKSVVLAFLKEVRSGKNPTSASKYLAAEVIANQVISEASQSIVRTPAEYAEHVFEMKAEHGDFKFEIDELLADGDKVFVRWTQTGKRIRECASCVYRVEAGLIVEYWIQIDRLGMQIQQDRL